MTEIGFQDVTSDVPFEAGEIRFPDARSPTFTEFRFLGSVTSDV